MPKENYFVITLELSFLALSVFFLIEVTSISAIQIDYNHRMTAYRVAALAGRAWSPIKQLLYTLSFDGCNLIGCVDLCGGLGATRIQSCPRQPTTYIC